MAHQEVTRTPTSMETIKQTITTTPVDMLDRDVATTGEGTKEDSEAVIAAATRGKDVARDGSELFRFQLGVNRWALNESESCSE